MSTYKLARSSDGPRFDARPNNQWLKLVGDVAGHYHYEDEKYVATFEVVAGDSSEYLKIPASEREKYFSRGYEFIVRAGPWSQVDVDAKDAQHAEDTQRRAFAALKALNISCAEIILSAQDPASRLVALAPLPCRTGSAGTTLLASRTRPVSESETGRVEFSVSHQR